MYDIEITYKTGNSFNSYKTEDNVDLPMATLEIAKENLQRIKIHWKIYEQKNGYYSTRQKIEYPPFCFENSDEIILRVDETTDHTCYPFWCGYFETLISARIIATGEDEMEFFV